jgi:DNA-directed RNA polymerase subunit RPC12/RpoP
MENKKLIYADDARRAILETEPKLAYCIERIKGVDAEPVKYGKWFFDGDWFEYICTNCRGHVGNRTNYNYCPHCGAYMREKQRKDIPF